MKTIARRLSPFAILLPASLLSACASLGNAGLDGSQQNPTNQLLNMIDEATREACPWCWYRHSCPTRA